QQLVQVTVVIIVVLNLCACPQDQTLTLVANLTKNRTTVETYVKEIKQQFKPGDPTYQEAKRRYQAAFSTYEGLVTTIRIPIQTGLHGDLQSLATQAEAASNEFIAYSAASMPQ